MKNNLVIISIAIICAALAGPVYYNYKEPKIAFVKSGILIQEYGGMRDANKKFEQEMQVVQANMDTLRNRYISLKAKEGDIPANQKADWAYELGRKESELQQYTEQAAGQMEIRKNELTGKILKDVNDFIQEYGKKNNYKIILGTTNDGSILYGNEADDLTDVILELLNKQPAESKK